MSNIWYTSDLHIGHRMVAKLRGFTLPGGDEADTVEHDAWLATMWDRVVKQDDQVFVLGDISINGGQHALDWIQARPGVKHLISGNHDPVHPMHSKALKVMPHWLNYFATITPFLRRKLASQTVLLSHFPYESWGDGPERPGARHLEYRLPDKGLPLLHGHTHGFEQAHDNMFHVGVDAWRELVPQDEIIDWVVGR